MSFDIKHSALILAASRALWDEITLNVRAVYVKQDGVNIYLKFIFDGVISEDNYESVSCAATEIMADFPNHNVEPVGVTLDFPNKISNNEEWYLLFKRHE